MSKKALALIALLIVNLIYGANYIIAKGVMPQYCGPAAFIMMRVVGAVVLFWLINLFIKEKIATKDFFRLAICGLFGVAVNQLFFFEGLSLASPVDSSIIMTFTPIIVLILSAIILKNKITKNKIAGIVLGSIGAITLITYSEFVFKDNSGSMLGNLFILINASSYSLYLVLVKPLMAKYKPITVISWVFLFGSAYVIPYSFKQFTEVNWNMPPDIIASIIFVVIAVTFLAYLLNIFALKYVQPSVSSSFIYLQPAVTIGFTLGYAYFTNTAQITPISWIHGACLALIFGGVYLIGKEK